MAAFLTDEWIAELEEAARHVKAPVGVDLSLQQVVVEADGARVEFAIRITDGTLSVQRGRVASADVTITQDRSTAEQIARGELSAQTAFMDGRLRIGGDLRSVVGHALDLASLEDVFAGARRTTTW